MFFAMQTKRKTRTEITLHTIERKVFLSESKTINIWCEFCAAEVEMISPELAASIFGIHIREIYRRIEQGDLHFFETETGQVYICNNSLQPNM